MLDGEVLGGLHCRTGRPRVAIGPRDVEIVEAGRGGPTGEKRVARDLPGGIRARAGPERRVQRGEEGVCVRHAR